MDTERRIAELEALLAEKERENAELRARVAELEKKVEAVLLELGRRSNNSNRPPSSDSPTDRAERAQRRGKSDRSRGGQPNHRGHRRELVPAAEVDDVVQLFPSHCEHCSAGLPAVEGADPIRFQLTELPAFEPHVTEYRRHSVKCPRCHKMTTAPHDATRIPTSPFGPRLMSFVGVLTGYYHLSRRKAASLLSDMMGVKLSLGAVSTVEKRVSDAVARPVQEAWQRVVQGDVKHTDGTTWYQSGVTLSLWVIATAVATVFKVLANGQKETLEPLFGQPHGVLVSDRATALTFWAMERRQICWAHLLRKFVSFSERDGPGGKFGRELLDYTGILFDYWHQYRNGELSGEVFRAWMTPLRQHVEALLERAVRSEIAHVAGSCADILEHRAALWTFVVEDGVEPTNNHAERELRAFVLWRKKSYGAQSERGNRFAERLMTIAHTARKQNKNVIEFITECCVAYVDGATPPSLFPNAA